MRWFTRGAYEKMLRHTNTEHAPWYVIPDRQKWYRNYRVTRVIVEEDPVN